MLQFVSYANAEIIQFLVFLTFICALYMKIFYKNQISLDGKNM